MLIIFDKRKRPYTNIQLNQTFTDFGKIIFKTLKKILEVSFD